MVYGDVADLSGKITQRPWNLGCIVSTERSHCTHWDKINGGFERGVSKDIWFFRSDSQWPARSPGIDLSDYVFRCYLKANVYKHRPSIIEELKEAIRQNVAEISPDVTFLAMENFINRCVWQIEATIWKISYQNCSPVFKGEWNICIFLNISCLGLFFFFFFVQTAGAVEYTECISAEG